MNLQDYLATNFYTRSELTRIAGISGTEFDRYQQSKMMPKASYVIRGEVVCTSFFGEFAETVETQFYAREYVSWLALLRQVESADAAFAIFREQYKNRIAELLAQGFRSDNEKITSGLDAHIEAEWVHFIDGIYGLCTKSGLPHDIAAKELAIIIINNIVGQESPAALEPATKNCLTAAVNLLDAASSMFAPHEVERSSRNRLINQVRAKYQLAH